MAASSCLALEQDSECVEKRKQEMNISHHIMFGPLLNLAVEDQGYATLNSALR